MSTIPPIPSFPPPEQSDSGPDLPRLLGILSDHKWLIIGVTALFCLGGVLYGMLATPIYRANALIQIENKNGTLTGLDMANAFFPPNASTATEIELIRSRTVIGKAVDNLHLDVQASPLRFPLIGDYLARRHGTLDLAEPLFGLAEYAWGGERIDVFRLDVDPPWIGKTFQLTATGNDGFTVQDTDGAVLLHGQVGEALDQHGIRLQLRELRARPGTRFELTKTEHANAVLAYQGALELSEVGLDTGLIRVAMTNPDPLQASLIVEEISRQFVLQNVERMSAEATGSLEFLRSRLPAVRRELDQAEKALSDYRKQHRSVDITLEAGSVLDQAVALDTRISELRLQQAELDRRFTPEHPAYKALLTQINGLTRRKSEIARTVQALPGTQQELLRLSQNVQVSSQIYTQLLNKAQELDLVRAGTVGNVRIVDPAVDEGGPVAPNRPLILAVATLIGALLSIGGVLLRKRLNPGLETPEALEELGLAVYATLPLSVRQSQLERRQQAGGNVVPLALDAPHDPAMECLRSLRTSLHVAMLEAPNNRLAISGPSPKVGKSFVCTNLAAIVAQTGKRVLLVDVDMRKGHLHRLLSTEAEPGLSDLLEGRSNFTEAVRPTQLEGLFLLPRGRIPSNPSELLMSPRFTTLLEQASASYDLIVLDSPPLLAVTDAAIVGQQAAINLLVARFGVSSAREIELALRRFAQNGIEIKGAVLNGLERRASAYGYGHAAYHHYEYKPDNL